MEETRNITCICCPMGCLVTVTLKEGVVIKAEGHSCARGEAYAKDECINPMRVFTSSVQVSDGRMLSVKTAGSVPKNKIPDCAKALREFTVSAPVEIGDVIIEDIANTGISLVATRNIPL